MRRCVLWQKCTNLSEGSSVLTIRLEWRWMHYVFSKRRQLSITLHDITTHKTTFWWCLLISLMHVLSRFLKDMANCSELPSAIKWVLRDSGIRTVGRGSEGCCIAAHATTWSTLPLVVMVSLCHTTFNQIKAFVQSLGYEMESRRICFDSQQEQD